MNVCINVEVLFNGGKRWSVLIKLVKLGKQQKKTEWKNKNKYNG